MKTYIALVEELKQIKIKNAYGEMKQASTSITSSMAAKNKALGSFLSKNPNFKYIDASKIFESVYPELNYRLSSIKDPLIKKKCIQFALMRTEISCVQTAQKINLITAPEADKYTFKYFPATYPEYVKWNEENAEEHNKKEYSKNKKYPSKTTEEKIVEAAQKTIPLVVPAPFNYKGYSTYISELIGINIEIHENGVIVIAPHTGSGKSFSMHEIAARIVANKYAFMKPNTKVMIVTPKKANLLESEVKRCFINLGHSQEEADILVVKINNSAEWTIEQFSSSSEINLTFSIYKNFFSESKGDTKEKNMCKKINRELTSLKEKLISVITNSESVESVKEPIETIKRELQQEILKYFNHKYKWKKKTRAQKFDFLKTNCPEIDKIFADISMENARCLLLSSSKFYAGLGGLLEPSSDTRESKFLEERAIIFWDEFDAFKEVALKHFIEKSLSSRVDLLAITKKITMYAEVWTSLKKRVQNNPKLRQKIDDLLLDISFFADKYNIHRIYSVEDMDLSSPKYFFKSNNSYISPIETDNEIIYINPSADEPFFGKKEKNLLKTNEYPLEEFLTDIMNVFNKWMLSLNGFAKYLYDIEKNTNLLINQDTILSGALEELGFEKSESAKAIKEIVKRGRYISINTSSSDCIYQNGFNLMSLIQDSEDIFSPEFGFSSIDETPERYLVTLASKHLIIGLSATGNFDTCIQNFNLKYLKEANNGNLFHDITTLTEYKNLTKYHENRLKLYEKGHFNYYPISATDCFHEESPEITKDLISEKYKNKFELDIPEDIINEILNICPSQFALNRFLFFVDSGLNVINTNKHFAGIVFCQKGLTASEKELLFKIYNNFAKEKNKRPARIKTLVKGNKTDKEFEFLMQEIKNGVNKEDVLFIFTTYATGAEGLNLQRIIEISEISKYINISDNLNPRNQVDLDFGIFDTPTYIVNESFDDGYSIENIIKNIITVNELYERKQITEIQKNIYIKESLSRVSLSNHIRDLSPSDYYTAMLRIITQAIGRLSRTELKNELVEFFFTETLINRLKLAAPCNTDLMGYENRRLVEFVKNYGMEPIIISEPFETKSKEKTMENKKEDVAHIKNKKASIKKPETINKQLKLEAFKNAENNAKILIESTIRDNLSRYRNNETVDEFFVILEKIKQDLFLLKHPTISREDLLEAELIYPGISNLYGELIEPGNEVGITRNKKGLCDTVLSGYSSVLKNNYVGPKSATLNLLKRNIRLRKYLENKGVRIYWKEEDFIILPSTFQQLYKGQLGELLLEYTSKELGIKISRPEQEIFEMSDFIIDTDKRDCLVDAKFYHEQSDNLGEDFIAKAKYKMEQTGCDSFIYINMRPQKTFTKPSIIDGVLLIPSVLNSNGEFFAIDKLKNTIDRYLKRELK